MPASNRPKDPETRNIVGHFSTAMGILDDSEAELRDLIESRLMDVAGINRTKVKDAMLATDSLMKEIKVIRTRAIKAAFRHLRDNLPSDI